MEIENEKILCYETSFKEDVESYKKLCSSKGIKMCTECIYCTGEYGTRCCKASIVGTIRNTSTACYKFTNKT